MPVIEEDTEYALESVEDQNSQNLLVPKAQAKTSEQNSVIDR